MIKLFGGLILLVICFAFPIWAQTPMDTGTEFTAAVVKEQKVTFAVVIVKRSVFDNQKFADGLIDHLSSGFGGIPVVLMAQDVQGAPTYYGRTDIAKFLANVPLDSIPWKQYVLKQTTGPSAQ